MFKDVTGERAGRLTAIAFSGRCKKPGGNAIWLCKCDCGKFVERPWANVRRSKTPSCGCYVKDRMSNLNKTHGGRNDRLYLVWMDMRRRCTDPRDSNFHNYGMRGITVCDEWQDYAKFREWAHDNGYEDDVAHGKCTIDRIDSDQGYFPQNCRWVDMKTQANNRRNNVLIEHDGETKTVSQWAQKYGVRYGLLRRRLAAGWNFERAIHEPPHN